MQTPQPNSTTGDDCLYMYCITCCQATFPSVIDVPLHTCTLPWMHLQQVHWPWESLIIFLRAERNWQCRFRPYSNGTASCKTGRSRPYSADQAKVLDDHHQPALQWARTCDGHWQAARGQWVVGPATRVVVANHLARNGCHSPNQTKCEPGRPGQSFKTSKPG